MSPSWSTSQAERRSRSISASAESSYTRAQSSKGSPRNPWRVSGFVPSGRCGRLCSLCLSRNNKRSDSDEGDKICSTYPRTSYLFRHVGLQRGADSLHSSSRALHAERHLRPVGLDRVASRLFRLLLGRLLPLLPSCNKKILEIRQISFSKRWDAV